MKTARALGKDRTLSLALIAFVVAAVVAWPVACSDVGLVLTFLFAVLASVATFLLLFQGGPFSAVVAAAVAGLLGLATIFVAAVVVSFTCSLAATLS